MIFKEISSVILSIIGFKYVYKKEILPLDGNNDKLNKKTDIIEYSPES